VNYRRGPKRQCMPANGILFNHESPAVGETFRDAADQPRAWPDRCRPRSMPVPLATSNSLRGLGPRRDYVEMQWADACSQDTPEIT